MAAPTISSINPTSASPGQKVVITGTNFNTATAVEFGGFDALFFTIQSPMVIWAYAPLQGTGTVAVINPDGTATIAGFYAVLTRVRLPDLPDLARPVINADQVYVWDSIRNILCRATSDKLPNAGGGGGGGGNIYTALGSPFKVRIGDDNHSYDAGTNTTTITDVRLLGKQDYVVSATDVSNEFENDRLTFDSVAGTVTISNYMLTLARHITVYADGVVSPEFNAFINTLKTQINTLLIATAPFLPSADVDGNLAAPGGLVPWFRPYNEIPTGWIEWVPGRGRSLIGRDISGDLSAPNGTAGGTVGGGTVLTEDNIPKIQLKMFSGAAQAGQLNPDPTGIKTVAWSSNHVAGNQDYDMRAASDDNPSMGHTSAFGKDDPDAIEVGLSPYRIVNFICSTITP